MICMKRTLCQKYKLAKNGIAESGRAFNRLDEAAPSHLKTEWLAQERVAQSSRIRDPAAMDLYDINIKKAPSKKEIELRLLEDDGFNADEDPDDFNIDILDDLEDDPADFTKTSDVWTNTSELTIIPLPSNLGVDQCRLDIAQQQDHLQGQIDGFDADEDPDGFNIDILDDLEDDPADFTETSDVWTNTPELTIIPLPSNLGVD
ncbi:hypothetical protein BDR04DRAFT_1161890 [Suillus decipiens]|nr:hypothetical protein BDR04DRAFT_1161890 [Suillus decipiens]